VHAAQPRTTRKLHENHLTSKSHDTKHASSTMTSLAVPPLKAEPQSGYKQEQNPCRHYLL
jgi:hypothetical protein